MKAVEHAVAVGLGAASFKSVPDMWHHRIYSTPESEAMSWREGTAWRTLNWREAGERVRQIANGLLSLGLEPEQRCAILGDTSVPWILADLGILCAGGATTTIYPASQLSECAYILGDCDAVWVFCDPSQVEKVEACRNELPSLRGVIVLGEPPREIPGVLTLADLEARGLAWEREHPTAYDDAVERIQPGDLATLMYTSGTTGEPKGVMLSHDAWVYEAAAIDAMGMISPLDKQLLFLPLAHVFAKAMQVIFIRLGVPTAVDSDLDRLADNLAEVRPTFVAAVPRTFEKMQARILAEVRALNPVQRRLFRWALEVGREVSRVLQRRETPNSALRLRHRLADRLVLRSIREGLGGRLRFFISGGAPLAHDVAEFLHAAGLLVLEGYGLTESSAASCVNGPDDFVFGTVGRPTPGCRVRIDDDGEILLCSRGVMSGYYKRPEDTQAALSPGATPDERWLHTGDLGTVLDSGHVVITGRKKDLIVTAGGKNIAPARFQNLFAARSPYVEHVYMHGDRRPYCVALVTLDATAVAEWATRHDLTWTDYADLARKPEVLALVQREMNRVNRELASFERAKRVAIAPEPWTVDNGLLTPSLKVKRPVVAERYHDAIEALYQGS